MKKTVLFCLVILVAVGSAQSFWTERKLVTTRPNWDYWWLNVRIGIDQFDTVYCAVCRYNYSQPDPEHDLYVLNSDGDTMRSVISWPGYDYQPIVKDGDSNNIYLGQPVLGQGPANSPHMDAGVTDDSNCVSTTHSRNSRILFTRLGPNGEHLMWLDTIYTGDPWSGRTSLAIDPRGWLHCTFADDREHLVYGLSTDKGTTWKWDTLESIFIMSHVRVVATPDTCIHIVFRTWTSGDQLRYLKLKPDGSRAVGQSIFAQGSARWDPNVALDSSGNLRIVYIDGATSAHNIFSTVLRGNLDAGGEPVPDSVLTLVPDTVIQYDAVRLAGPKICVDSHDRAHVLFEQGVYGCNQTKYVYHIREERGQSIAEMALPEHQPMLRVYPNPVPANAIVRFSVSRFGPVQISLFDALGRRVRQLVDREESAGFHSVSFNRQGLPTGAYFLVLESQYRQERTKLLIAE
ncbi:hypothetical protein CH330_01130 [candidate division WOR-3 bacterium JGI_Cruoil_03_51_56]|uniref:Secretion system C-terminal sorting domain-containing protein n=1 Tax=candidate division WOR-3 bacterium JGI_Cruoil_03_51_56 TaxID=1973747 RepID=A0A235BXT5_UNCW3|nr:MAG: hypothetical protein CH330_01130 [candidate division WOR-3 bacterium JGI_Cruoil_03_51_56]